jgi:autotransporter-associated beta strand protein
MNAQTIASLSNSVASVVSAPLTLRANPLTLNAAAGPVPGGPDLLLSGAIGQSGGTDGVTKTGAGTVQLSGANTYTGNTTVNGGTLEIVQPTIATNSTVTWPAARCYSWILRPPTSWPRWS